MVRGASWSHPPLPGTSLAAPPVRSIGSLYTRGEGVINLCVCVIVEQVSAKTAMNVEQAFLDVVTRASKRVQEDEIFVPDQLDITDTKPASDDKCPC